MTISFFDQFVSLLMLDVSNISTLLCSVFSLCLLATHGVMNLRRGMCTAERSACSVIRMSRINGVWEHLKACRLGDLSDIHEAQSETQTMISLAISNKYDNKNLISYLHHDVKKKKEYATIERSGLSVVIFERGDR